MTHKSSNPPRFRHEPDSEDNDSTDRICKYPIALEVREWIIRMAIYFPNAYWSRILFFCFLMQSLAVEVLSQPCTVCGQTTSLWCSRCQNAWYCSPEHLRSVSTHFDRIVNYSSVCRTGLVIVKSVSQRSRHPLPRIRTLSHVLLARNIQWHPQFCSCHTKVSNKMECHLLVIILTRKQNAQHLSSSPAN